MSIYGKEITPDASYGTEPAFAINGTSEAPRCWRLSLSTTGATDAVLVSFDGVNDHVVLRNADGLRSVSVTGKYREVWVKSTAGTPKVFATVSSDGVIYP